MPPPPHAQEIQRSHGMIRWLTYLMFMMFAMTTDSVGVIIPEVIREFRLSMTAASSFHYATMGAIAIAGLGLGFLADKLGRKATIILGLSLFALNSFLFAAGNHFIFFVCLLVVSGAAIGIFKTGALALIGDITSNSGEHTSTMNMVEGFFGVGAIIGPAVVTALLGHHVSWKWLYLIAGGLCVLLILVAFFVPYPKPVRPAAELSTKRDLGTLGMLKDPYALGFSLALFLYVAVECSIYVWMPTLLKDYTGSASWVASYSITLFFLLRAGGRFLGAWILRSFSWSLAMALLSGAILSCFLGSILGGISWAVFLLPLSGLFMSVIYPTLNSKGISCFPRQHHGSVSGIILFFSCLAAAAGPFAMGAVSDAFGSPRHGFLLASALAALLFAGLLWNHLFQPAGPRLKSVADQPGVPTWS